jgi:hypothetical protein
MGLFTQTANSIKGLKPGHGSPEDRAPEDTEADDTSILCAARAHPARCAAAR